MGNNKSQIFDNSKQELPPDIHDIFIKFLVPIQAVA